MKKSLHEDKDYRLWSLLHQARSALFKVREKDVNPYGITATQSAVLFVISSIRGNATPNLISRWLIREPHTTSNILNRMKEQGLVDKVRNPNNRSEVIVSLTKKGRQIYRQTEDIEIIREMMSCLSEEERQQLYSSLKKLRDKALSHLIEIRDVPYP